jgi:ABC-type glycerol-3-phosphate transport system permease component
MIWKRALWMSVLLYFTSFAIGILFAVLLGYDFSSQAEPTTSFWITGMVFNIILAGLFTWWYFKKVKASAKEGLFFGLFAISVGFIFDAIFLVPTAIASGSFSEIWKYYGNSFFFATITLLLLATYGVGWYLEKKK